MTPKQAGLQTLHAIATDVTEDAEQRIHAANSLIHSSTVEIRAPLWYDVDLKDLTVFCLKAVVAAIPAVMLALLVYIGFFLFNTVAGQLLGGF